MDLSLTEGAPWPPPTKEFGHDDYSVRSRRAGILVLAAVALRPTGPRRVARPDVDDDPGLPRGRQLPDRGMVRDARGLARTRRRVVRLRRTWWWSAHRAGPRRDRA